MPTPSEEPFRSKLVDAIQADPLEGNTPEAASARFRLTVQLADAGIDMMRQNLRRRHPEASEEEIASRLRDWLRERPGAEYGDACGEPNPDRFA